jgi:hypothetical protein
MKSSRISGIFRIAAAWLRASDLESLLSQVVNYSAAGAEASAGLAAFLAGAFLATLRATLGWLAAALRIAPDLANAFLRAM